MKIPLSAAMRGLDSGVSFADPSAQREGLLREIAMFERDLTPLEKRLKQCRDEADKIAKSLASLKAPNFSGRKPAAFRDYTESVRELSQAVNLMTKALIGLDIVYELKQEANNIK